MAKIETLADVPNVAPLNGNNDKIETAFQNTLSRDGSTPNQMEANLDMNNNRILNLPDAVHNQEPITLAQAANIASVSVAFSRENVGAVLYPVTQAETDNSITPENYYYPPGDVRRYGAVGDGATDDTAAIQAAFDQAAETTGANVYFPPGTYLCGSQVTITGPSTKRIEVSAYGAEITTSGTIAGIKITGGSPNGGVSVYGLKINHRGNASATYGFWVVGPAWHIHLYDCVVEAHGVGASYAAYKIEQGTASDQDTGCFWVRLVNSKCRKRSGADSGDITYGLFVRGAANALNVVGCKFANTTTGIYLESETAVSGGYIANGVVVEGTSFETYGTALHVHSDNAATQVPGLRIVHNRYEDGTTVYKLTGMTGTTPNAPIWVAGNYYVSNAGTMFDNANSIPVNVFDFAITPDTAPALIFDNAGPMTLRNINSSHHVLAIRPQGGARGLSIEDNGGTSRGNLSWRSGSYAQIAGAASSTLYALGIRGISATTTPPENLRGTVTLSGGTATVTFSTAEPDTSYFIALGGSAAESFSWASKGTGGFTINSSNGSSTAVVNWILIR